MIQLWNVVVNGMAFVLQWLYGITEDMHVPSYALAIILFVIIIKIILSPLFHKQMSSMRKMQQLQPKIKEIQNKSKGKDPREMQEAVMSVYRENGVNPMSGCLPTLIQLPILFALYRAMLTFDFARLPHAGFFWVPNLSDPDKLFIIPILAGLATLWQSLLTTGQATDPSQRMMIYTMPIFIVFMAWRLPSGLGLYWIISSVTAVIQQYVVNRMTPAVGVKEVQEVAEDRKDGKNGRGGRGGRPPGAKGKARTGGNRGAGRTN